MSDQSANKPVSGYRAENLQRQSGMEGLDDFPTIKGLRAGERIFQHYLLRRMLGRGGMGVVWLAWDEQLDEEVALKFLPEIFSSDRLALDDFKREARRSRRLSHPNIVRIHNFEKDERCAGISMEFVDGDTLSNMRLDREDRSFRVGELVPIMRQLCSALSHAHDDAKIVHRDLKAANLMLTKAGQLKVADFGLASTLNHSLSLASVPKMGGTLAYMSPQQLYGELPTVADDVYALGATVYDLLTGKPPFFGGDVTLQIRDKKAVPMRVRREQLGLESGNIPEEWEEVVAACLAKSPEDRPASASEIAIRLGLVSATPSSSRTTATQIPEIVEPERVEAAVPAVELACAESATVEPSPEPETAPPPEETPIPSYPEESKRVVSVTYEIARPPARRHLSGVVIALLIITGLMGAGTGWWYGIEKPRGERAQLRAVRTKVEQFLNAAVSALEEKRFEDARAAYNDVLVLDASNAAAKSGLEEVDRSEADKRADDAKKREQTKALEEQVAERLRLQKIHDGLSTAQAALTGGRHADAMTAYEGVLALDRDNAEAKEGLASARKAEREAKLEEAKAAIKDKRYTDARIAYERVLSLDPGNEVAKAGLASAQKAERESKIEEAAENARKEAVAKQLEAKKHIESGRGLLKDGKFDEAENAGKEALAKTPDSPEAKAFVSEVIAARTKGANKAAVQPTPAPPKSNKKITPTKSGSSGKKTSDVGRKVRPSVTPKDKDPFFKDAPSPEKQRTSGKAD